MMVKELEKESMVGCDERVLHADQVEIVRRRALPTEILQDLGELFKVLGDRTRLRIVHALMQGDMCVCDIAAATDMGQSAISHQLRVLRQARLVSFRKEGKLVWYSLNDNHVATLLAQGLEHVSHN